MTSYLTDKVAAHAGARRHAGSLPAGYPPSSTGSVARPGSNPGHLPNSERLRRRIRAEYLEMPGLCLTLQQAQRLWSLEPRTCAALLTALIDSGFLRRTPTGLFVLRTSSR